MGLHRIIQAKSPPATLAESTPAPTPQTHRGTAPGSPLAGRARRGGRRPGRPGAVALDLLPHRVEVHEPGFEQGPGHGLQGGVHAPVQLDLVVQRSQDVGDGTLFRKGREKNR